MNVNAFYYAILQVRLSIKRKSLKKEAEKVFGRRISEISILRGGSPAHVSIVRELLITRDSYGKSAANDCYRTDLAGHCELGS